MQSDSPVACISVAVDSQTAHYIVVWLCGACTDQGFVSLKISNCLNCRENTGTGFLHPHAPSSKSPCPTNSRKACTSRLYLLGISTAVFASLAMATGQAIGTAVFHSVPLCSWKAGKVLALTFSAVGQGEGAICARPSGRSNGMQASMSAKRANWGA